MSRLAVQNEIKDERRLPLIPARYDPVRADARSRLLGDVDPITEQGAPYFILKPGYIQRGDGLFIINPIPDIRSNEARRLQSRAAWLNKESQRLWPEGKEIFQGLTSYRCTTRERKGSYYTVEHNGVDAIVFHIFSPRGKRALMRSQLLKEHQGQRQDDVNYPTHKGMGLPDSTAPASPTEVEGSLTRRPQAF